MGLPAHSRLDQGPRWSPRSHLRLATLALSGSFGGCPAAGLRASRLSLSVPEPLRTCFTGTHCLTRMAHVGRIGSGKRPGVRLSKSRRLLVALNPERRLYKSEATSPSAKSAWRGAATRAEGCRPRRAGGRYGARSRGVTGSRPHYGQSGRNAAQVLAKRGGALEARSQQDLN
jgi:hypothetical protein